MHQRRKKEKLTDREIEVMKLYANPHLEKAEICGKLSITMNTLNVHIGRIFSKLGETERFPAAFRFFQHYPEYRPLLDEYIALAS